MANAPFERYQIRTSLHGRKLGIDDAGYLTGDGFRGTRYGQNYGGDYKLDNPILHTDLFEDFIGKTLSTRFGTSLGSDGACALAHNAQVGGVVRLTTGAGAGATMAVNGSQLHSELNWKANSTALRGEFRVGAVSALTTLALFIGFTDQVSALEMPATLSAGALTTNFSDGVGFLFDTAATTANIKLVGVKGDTDATFQELIGVTPSTSTFNKYRIEIDENENATFFIDGLQVGTIMASALTKTVALTPVVVAFARAASSRTIDVDYIQCQQIRP